MPELLRTDETAILQALGHSGLFDDASQSDPANKRIVMQVKVAGRCQRELKSYEKEAQDQQARIEKLLAAEADEHDVRKQRQVLGETLRMLPDCQQRLDRAIAELKALIQQ